MYSSGNTIVDEVGRIAISGNIIPPVWFKTITKEENGKPYLLAMMILADIVYWYRPVEVRDETTGQIISWKKKFKADLYQRSYASFKEQFGEEIKTIQRAIIRLEGLGVVQRVFRTLEINGVKYNNVMYLELHADVLYMLTYGVDKDDHRYGQNCPEGMDKNDHRGGQNCPEGMDKNDQRYGQKCPDITKNTYKDYNTENPIHQSDAVDGIDDLTNAYMAIIRENLEYDHHMEHDQYNDKQMFEEIYQTICDVVCVKRNVIRINGVDYPYELVKSRFLKINDSHVEYVMDCMKNTVTKITNIRSYLITALYNAPSTMNHFYQQEVQHDMYGGG